MFRPMRPIVSRPTGSPVCSVRAVRARPSARDLRSTSARLPERARVERRGALVVGVREPRLLEVRVDRGERVLPAPDDDDPRERERCPRRSAACRGSEPIFSSLPSERAAPLLGYAPAGANREDDGADELAQRPAGGPLVARRVGRVPARGDRGELRRARRAAERDRDGGQRARSRSPTSSSRYHGASKPSPKRTRERERTISAARAARPRSTSSARGGRAACAPAAARARRAAPAGRRAARTGSLPERATRRRAGRAARPSRRRAAPRSRPAGAARAGGARRPSRRATTHEDASSASTGQSPATRRRRVRRPRDAPTATRRGSGTT